jgi:pimeloyl-ACP methyl ester carboxylesterase
VTMGAAAEAGFAEIDGARIYYEIVGDGPPFVMIHAGVADSRQWTNEFNYFASRFRVLRYDLRGAGKSEPVDGEFSHLGVLTSLLDHLQLDEPLILMGCSMGGGLAMNFALEHPSRARALIMVGSAPTGLQLDVPSPALFAEVEKAFGDADYDRVAELETEIWFVGEGRQSADVDPAMRRLAYDMSRTILAHEVKGLGKRLPDTDVDAVERLSELAIPVLAVVGEHDTRYIVAAADYMVENLPNARKKVMNDAAHLPNLDHPDDFQKAVDDFLGSVVTAT